MAQIWFEESKGNWSTQCLTENQFQLDSLSLDTGFQMREMCSASEIIDKNQAAPSVLHCQLPNRETWALLVPRCYEVSVNGVPVLDCIVMLCHRDAIRWVGVGTLYFSTEKLACLEAFPDPSEAIYCGRCKLPLESGQKAVRCPQCSIWHCEDPSLGRAC